MYIQYMQQSTDMYVLYVRTVEYRCVQYIYYYYYYYSSSSSYLHLTCHHLLPEDT